jgi:hypothetical protein
MRKSGDRVTSPARQRQARQGARVIGRDRVIGGMQHFLRILRATLREIFDENAYDRFLRRTDSARSVASYREFARERDSALNRKPRCC